MELLIHLIFMLHFIYTVYVKYISCVCVCVCTKILKSHSLKLHCLSLLQGFLWSVGHLVSLCCSWMAYNVRNVICWSLSAGFFFWLSSTLWWTLLYTLTRTMRCGSPSRICCDVSITAPVARGHLGPTLVLPPQAQKWVPVYVTQ